LDKNISILRDKEQELEKEIDRLSDQQPIDVDEAVTTTAPLYKQYVTQKNYDNKINTIEMDKMCKMCLRLQVIECFC
jgi:ribosomal protein L33